VSVANAWYAGRAGRAVADLPKEQRGRCFPARITPTSPENILQGLVKAASEVFSGEKPDGQRYALGPHVLLREFHVYLAKDQQHRDHPHHVHLGIVGVLQEEHGGHGDVPSDCYWWE
jgi:hypothetical protein